MVSDVRSCSLPRSLILLAHKVKASPGVAVGGVYPTLSPWDRSNERSASSGEHLKWVESLISDPTLPPLFLSASQSQEIIRKPFYFASKGKEFWE